jgi:hypothetical protein
LNARRREQLREGNVCNFHVFLLWVER